MLSGNIFSGLSTKLSDVLGTGEFSTPVGEHVLAATSEALLSPNLSINLQTCDLIDSREDGPATAVKAIRRRLKSDNAKVVSLTLALCDGCVKNCSPRLHRAFGSREFLGDLGDLTDGRMGREVREQALDLIQSWGRAFPEPTDSNQLYYREVYNRLRSMGVQFPVVDESAVLPILMHAQRPSITAGQEASAAGARAAPVDDEAKLRSDLSSVMEQVVLCQQILQESGSESLAENGVLKDLIGFLEACTPRMVYLVENGLRGGLEPSILEACLKVNDALIRTLEAVRTGEAIPVESAELEFILPTPTGSTAPGTTQTTPTDANTPYSSQTRDLTPAGGVLEASTNPFSIGWDEDDEPVPPPTTQQTGARAVQPPTTGDLLGNADIDDIETFLNSRT